MLLRELKKIFHKELDAGYPKEEVSSFFYILLEHYLGLERFVLALQPDLIISKKQEQSLFEALSRLKLEHPIQYITGICTFMDLPIRVNEQVLIPRPETEELVRWILSEYHQMGEKDDGGLKVLDIGTGSGCIAIALAKNIPGSKVFALDFSEEILAVARDNAERNKVKIEFLRADVLELEHLDDKFDVIVSNPPYVRESEREQIHNNVKLYEPDKALFVSDDSPLVFYKKIADLASTYLTNKGAVFLEINQYLAKETKQLLEDRNFLEIELRKDMFKNDRLLKGIRNSYE